MSVLSCLSIKSLKIESISEIMPSVAISLKWKGQKIIYFNFFPVRTSFYSIYC